MSADIGLSRKQKCFVKVETTVGTLVFPDTASELAGQCVIPAGNAVINQAPSFVDSEEIKDTLDIVDQFQSATPPGEFTLPTYIRGCSAGSAPQGGVLFESLMGDNMTESAGSVGYGQAMTSKSFSMWIQTDHFVQGLSGCSVNQAVFGVTNEGAVKCDFTGQGMKMVWAGTDANSATIDADGSAATNCGVVNADRFSADARICFTDASGTILDSNGATGFVVTRASGTELAWTPAVSASIDSSQVVKGFLPSIVEVGTPMKGRFTDVSINSAAANIKNTDITVAAPKKYITDEVGTTYPTKYIEDVRNISSTLNVYFTKSDAKYFAQGYVGDPVPVLITFKSADSGGKQLRLNMPRVRLNVPTINHAAPAVELSMEMKAMGTDGEDSMRLIFETN